MTDPDDRWHGETFEQDKVQLDPYTSLEGVFVTGGCLFSILAGCLSIGALAEQQPFYLAGTLVGGLLAGILFLIYSKLSDTIELDFTAREIKKYRRFGGKLIQLTPISFEKLHGVVVHPTCSRDHKNGPLKWKYGLAVILKPGKLLLLTRETQTNFSNTEAVAGRLARRIGSELIAGKMEHRLKITEGGPPVVTFELPAR